MTLLHPVQHDAMKAVDMSFSGEGNDSMKTTDIGLQADTRFLRNILTALAVITCLLGLAGFAAMP